MTAGLGLLPWAAFGLAGIGAMQWGSARCAATLESHRGAAGLRAVAAGALLGLATAAPEVSVNLAAVAFGWPDLGLGAALGSNVPALPLAFLLAWLAKRRQGPEAAPLVSPEAVPVQALPYLLVVLLLAALTLTPGAEGLQPLDAVALAVAWLAFLAMALRRRETPRGSAPAPGFAAAWLGLPAVALGALAAVMAARHLGEALGVPDLVTGLFGIGLLCALPESLSAWTLTRQGRSTTAVATAMSDGIVSLTVALVPPALAGAAVGDRPLLALNLGFLAALLLGYIALDRLRRGAVLGGGWVALCVAGYAALLAATGWLLS